MRCHPRSASCNPPRRDRSGPIHVELQTYAWHAGCSDRRYTTKDCAMSNLLTPVDLQLLQAVTGGAAVSSTASSRCSTSDALLQQLTSLSSTIKDIGNTANKTGFSTTEVLMLGMLMNQNRQVNVFVRRPFW
jgi:hypothetical protein